MTAIGPSFGVWTMDWEKNARHTCFLKDVNGFLWVGSNYGELNPVRRK
jgi:hypothetical protein